LGKEKPSKEKGEGKAMSLERMVHEASFSIAQQLVACLEGCLRPEESSEAFAVFYDIVHDGIEGYQAGTERQEKRLHPHPPSDN
jgi:hypothetical protein